MPDTGFDPYGGLPQGGAIDASGGGMDPSYYYSLAPGGAFPGDLQNFLGYLAAASQGRNYGNPNYDIPDWLTHAGRFGQLLAAHERNVQSPGAGQQPSDPSAGYPYQTFSGPGAPYGPANGPGTGLIDYGRPVGQNWDGPEFRPPGQGETGPVGRGHGGGGGSHQTFNFQPYQGMNYQSHFVDNQPIAPFTPGPYSPTRMVPGNISTQTPPPAAPKPPRIGGRAGAGGRGGGNSGGGTGGGVALPGGGQNRPGGGSGAPPLPGSLTAPGPGDPFTPGAFSANVGANLRDNILGGVDPNALERGTPSWLRDPTAGIYDTSGFPSATLPAPNLGETFNDYMTRLHDAGFDYGDISSILGRYGYQTGQSTPNGMGPGAPTMDWGWGTGPIVRGDNGYSFANSGPGQGGEIGQPGGAAYAIDPRGNRIRVDFGANGSSGAAGGPGGGQGGSSFPDTLSSLLTPLY